MSAVVVFARSPVAWRVCFIGLTGGGFSWAAGRAAGKEYVVYVVCEGADRVVRVRFAEAGGAVEKEISTAAIASDISGPHGIAAAPDRSAYYVTLGHGRPYGSAQKYSASDDQLTAEVGLGNFPATVDVTPDGKFLLLAVNFNLHGEMVASSVSVVETSAMLEVARIPTCVMPHGSRINAAGTRQYSACMMDDTLVEIDTRSLRVSRYFRLSKGAEQGFTVSPAAKTANDRSSVIPALMKNECSPTWAQPSVDGSKIYVACNKSNEIVEVDAESWGMVRRFAARNGVYNLAVTGDGRLIATNKRDASVSVFDLKTAGKLREWRRGERLCTAWWSRRMIAMHLLPRKALGARLERWRGLICALCGSRVRWICRRKPRASRSGRWKRRGGQ